MPVIPATREAEAGELAELRRQRFGVSWERAIALQPRQLEQNSVSKTERKRKENGENLMNQTHKYSHF